MNTNDVILLGRTTTATDPVVMGLMSGWGWGDVAVMQDAEEERWLLSLSPADFEAEKQKAKREHRFPTWEAWLVWARTLEGKRRQISNTATEEKDMVSVLLGLRADYMREGPRYFATEAERDREVYRVEAQVCKEAGGAWRLNMAREREKARWMPEMMATVARVRRGADAMRNVKRMMGEEKAKMALRMWVWKWRYNKMSEMLTTKCRISTMLD